MTVKKLHRHLYLILVFYMSHFKHERLLLLPAVSVFLGVCFNLAFGSRPIVELLDVWLRLREVNVIHYFLIHKILKRFYGFLITTIISGLIYPILFTSSSLPSSFPNLNPLLGLRRNRISQFGLL